MLKKTVKNKIYIFCAIFFTISILFYAYQESWIVFVVPYKKEIAPLSTKTKPTTAQLYFWKHEKWNQEKVSYIKSPDQTKNIKTLAHLYFRLLDDEELINNDISVNSVTLHVNKQIAFISYNQSPFNEEDNTLRKLMIIEGLLKTLRKNSISIPSIQFLTNHQSLQDDHLDFTVPWPLRGYL